MSDFKKQWINIPKRKNKNPLQKKDVEFKNDFPELRKNLNTYSSNSFEALVYRKINISNTIYDKAKKGFDELNSYPILSTSPTFPN